MFSNILRVKIEMFEEFSFEGSSHMLLVAVEIHFICSLAEISIVMETQWCRTDTKMNTKMVMDQTHR